MRVEKYLAVDDEQCNYSPSGADEIDSEAVLLIINKQFMSVTIVNIPEQENFLSTRSWNIIALLIF